MVLADWIQLGMALVAIVGLTITILNNKRQFQSLNEQMKLSCFADYTKRYQEIILNFPECIYREDFTYSQLSDSEKEKTLKYMRIYFDLCSEQLFLHNQNYIEPKIWKNWEEGIRWSFSRKAYRDAWDITCQNTVYYNDFSDWIRQLINESKGNSKT